MPKERLSALFAADSPHAHLLVADVPRFSTFLLEALTDTPAGLELSLAPDGFDLGRLMRKLRFLDL